MGRIDFIRTVEAQALGRPPVVIRIESVFAVVKRGVIGVFHQVSVKHLGRYVQEFAFRLNEGHVARKTVDRIDSFIAGVSGKRLTYQVLIQ